MVAAANDAEEAAAEAALDAEDAFETVVELVSLDDDVCVCSPCVIEQQTEILSKIIGEIESLDDDECLETEFVLETIEDLESDCTPTVTEVIIPIIEDVTPDIITEFVVEDEVPDIVIDENPELEIIIEDIPALCPCELDDGDIEDAIELIEDTYIANVTVEMNSDTGDLTVFDEEDTVVDTFTMETLEQVIDVVEDVDEAENDGGVVDPVEIIEAVIEVKEEDDGTAEADDCCCCCCDGGSDH